jgi:murein DD-endopeptidase MepM/ murein hydrolase activator NlpD
MIIRICIIISFLFATAAAADIYRYVDKNGVECFTDSPVNKNAVMIMKDRPPARQSPRLKHEKNRANSSAIVRTKLAALPGGSTGTSRFAGNLPVSGPITSFVGLRHDPFDGTLRFHNGVDIAIPEGTPVKPIAAGYVIFSGNRGGYGNMVVIEHPDGMRTIYAHNSVNMVSAGEEVGSDTVISLSGSTGRSTGPHLHFEAWKDGINVTDDILKYGSGESPRHSMHGHVVRRDPVRTAILPDGSVLFTNLPNVHP